MISLIQAAHYKCLRAVYCPLDPFQVLVGPNASGKSTFLDVLAFLSDFLRQGLEGAVKKRGKAFDDLVWRAEGSSFALAVEMCVPKRLLSNRNGSHPFCRYELLVGNDGGDGGAKILTENFFLLQKPSPRPDERQPERFGQDTAPSDELVVGRSQRTPTGWRRVVQATEEGRVYVNAETTGWRFDGKPAAGKSGLTIVPQELERFPVSTWAYEFLMHGVQPMALQGVAMREPCHPEAPRSFRPDGSNLPLVVGDLKNADPERFARWIKHLQTSLPLADIEVKEREADRHLYLLTRWRPDLEIPSWLLSDGTLRMLALTVLAYVPTTEAVYLVEEPENGIHPLALETVFQSLSSVYEGQVCVATHSPLLLHLADPKQILCFTLTPSGATSVVRGHEHPRLKEWRGRVDLAELFASGVLG